MKAFHSIISLLAAPVLMTVAEAADAPGALSGYDFATGDQAKVGYAITPSYTEKFQELQKAIVDKVNAMDEATRNEFLKTFDASVLIPYREDIWADKAAYAEYKKEWGKTGITGVAQVALSIQEAGSGTFRFYAITNVNNSQQAPVTISSLTYDPVKNTWTSAHGELTAKEFKATDDYVYKAQIGTEWNLEKEDSFAKTTQMIRVSKTTDNKAAFVSYHFVEMSKITGAVLSNQSYTLLFPIKQAKLDIGTPGTR